MKSVKELQVIANTIRKDIIRMLCEAKSGHSAGPLGMADMFTAVYFHAMKHDPKRPGWEERDRFVLSNGHICPVHYATLAEAGYFPTEELMTLRKFGTRLQGHPHLGSLPGVDNTSGPLGQGISVACGMALGAKMDKRDFKVYCSMGDGELDEGQPWEAFLFAAAHKLDNLIVFVDRNYIQIDGNTEEVLALDPLDKKFEAFNFNVISIDGNDMEQVVTAFDRAKKYVGKPTVILAKTVPGKGVSFMEGKCEWHGMPPKPDQAAIALEELGE